MDFYSNLTATSSSNASSIYPTIFEILSSDEIDDLLSPSVRYIVANLVARNPNKWTIKINNWFDEWFMLAAKLAIESHYLKNWDATFIENFYGLKRIDGTNPVLLNALRKNPPVEIPLRLRDAQRRVVLFEKVVAPYLTGKLELAYSKLASSKHTCAEASFRERELDNKSAANVTSPICQILSADKKASLYSFLTWELSCISYPEGQVPLRFWISSSKFNTRV